ncbi:MAG: hypothetical protein AAGC55_30815 [Myxococcota bacterium]
MLRELEDQLIRLLKPLTEADATALGQAVKRIVPWVADESPDPDDEEISKLFEGMDAVALVTLAGSEVEERTTRKVFERITWRITLYVANKAAQETTTLGTSRRVGIYDLIDLVRGLLDGASVAGCPGSQYRFERHERVGYSRGKLTWQLQYSAQVERPARASQDADAYERVVGEINQSAANGFERGLETS